MPKIVYSPVPHPLVFQKLHLEAQRRPCTCSPFNNLQPFAKSPNSLHKMSFGLKFLTWFLFSTQPCIICLLCSLQNSAEPNLFSFFRWGMKPWDEIRGWQWFECLQLDPVLSRFDRTPHSSWPLKEFEFVTHGIDYLWSLLFDKYKVTHFFI